MKRVRFLLSIVVVLVLASALPCLARAAAGPGAPATPDGVIAAYAAVGCGLFSRALIGGIVVPGVIAGAVATCGLMLFITLTQDE